MAVHFEYSIEVPQSPEQAFALFDALPRTSEWLAPCTALEKLTCRYWDKMFEIVVDSRVAKTPTGSKLTNSIEMTPKNFIFKLMAPVMRKQLAKQTINAMESLRDILAAKHP